MKNFFSTNWSGPYQPHYPRAVSPYQPLHPHSRDHRKLPDLNQKTRRSQTRFMSVSAPWNDAKSLEKYAHVRVWENAAPVDADDNRRSNFASKSDSKGKRSQYEVPHLVTNQRTPVQIQPSANLRTFFSCNFQKRRK